jgi:hypothetical protein
MEWAIISAPGGKVLNIIESDEQPPDRFGSLVMPLDETPTYMIESYHKALEKESDL